jgi:hypothetical protein
MAVTLSGVTSATVTANLPASCRLAWWGTAWLRGHVVTDFLVDAVLDGDATHAVAGLPGSEATETLVGALGRLRAAGATAFGAALPTEGDPVGLGGPRDFNTAALEAGEAVVVAGADLGLVPQRTGAAIAWRALPAQRRQLPDVGEADRSLRGALLEAAEGLARLDVARWRPEVADRLMNLRRREEVVAPDGVPARCVELAGRGLQATEIVELALEDDGGAISASEIEARRSTLQPLARAGRHALVAACSPEVWPPG